MDRPGADLAPLAAIVQSSSDAILLAVDGVLSHVNPAAERMFGYSAQELIGRSPAMLSPPELGGQTTALVREAAAGRECEIETRRRCRDGSLVDVSLKIFPIRDAGGAVIGTGSIARDISERKRAEMRARAAEERFRTLLEATPDATIMIDESGSITLANAAAEDLFGWARGALVGETVEALIPVAARQRHVGLREGFNRRPTSRLVGRTVAAVRRDGSEFEAEVTLTPVATSTGPAVLAGVRDISLRIRTERAIGTLAAIVHSTRDAIIGTDLDGIVTSWNGGAERVYGYSAEEMVGRPLRSIEVNDERSELEQDALAHAADGSELIDAEFTHRTRDGREIAVEVTISPVRAADGRVVGSSAIARDVTERNRGAAELLRAQELFRLGFETAPVGMFIAGLDGIYTQVNDAFCRIVGRSRTSFAAWAGP